MGRYRWLVAVLAGLAVAAAACEPAEEPAAPEPADTPEVEDAPGDTPDPTPDEPAEAPDAYGEAPGLAELVAAGELPPVEERLPDEPVVVQPWDRVGDYGGTWNTAMLGPADTHMLFRKTGYEGLTRWNLEFTEVSPNIVESIDINDDVTEFTFHLRPGLKWSDGELFTADDIVFWYNDYQLRPELGGGAPSWMVTGGEPGVVEKVDDHTVLFSFEGGPNSLLPQVLATPSGRAVPRLPRHYLEQFHIDYNPDAEALAEAEGYADWAELLDARAGDDAGGLAVGLPTLYPWTMATAVGEGAQVVFERNPYYWKVDPEGNQLPYIDQVVFDVLEDAEVMVFQAINGQLDFHAFHINDLANKPLFAEHRDDGDFDFFDMTPAFMNYGVIYLNLTHKDPVKREIFQNRDFRIGLSHAMNREEIIDVVFVGQGEPYQAAPRPESDLFHEQLAHQYTEYDPELANEHLDAAGYSERDAQGFRLGPDGQRISFDVDVSLHGDYTGAQLDALELTAGYWAEVGVDMRVNTLDRSLFYVRKADNDHDANVWVGPGGEGFEVFLDPRSYFPFSGESNWAVPWAEWFMGSEDAEEPPAAVQEQMQLYRQMQSTVDYDDQVELMGQLLDIAAEEFWVLGLALIPESYGIVRNDFRNVPERMYESWQYLDPAPSMPEQYFIEP